MKTVDKCKKGREKEREGERERERERERDVPVCDLDLLTTNFPQAESEAKLRGVRMSFLNSNLFNTLSVAERGFFFF